MPLQRQSRKDINNPIHPALHSNSSSTQIQSTKQITKLRFHKQQLFPTLFNQPVYLLFKQHPRCVSLLSLLSTSSSPALPSVLLSTLSSVCHPAPYTHGITLLIWHRRPSNWRMHLCQRSSYYYHPCCCSHCNPACWLGRGDEVSLRGAGWGDSPGEHWRHRRQRNCRCRCRRGCGRWWRRLHWASQYGEARSLWQG